MSLPCFFLWLEQSDCRAWSAFSGIIRAVMPSAQQLCACRSLGGVRRSRVRLPLGLRSLTLLRCLSRHSSLVLCSCLTLQAMAPKAYLTGKSQDKVAAKKTRKKPGGPCLRRCWAELHGWSFTRSCFLGWTLAQNQASLDWASSVPRTEAPDRHPTEDTKPCHKSASTQCSLSHPGCQQADGWEEKQKSCAGETIARRPKREASSGDRTASLCLVSELSAAFHALHG